MGTATDRASAQTEFFRHGEGLGIPGIKCDGMDVLAVRAAAQEAASFARAGNGPMIVEMNTYRYRGHSISDPAKYRPKEEVREVRETRDPIQKIKRDILSKGEINEKALNEIDGEVKKLVREAAEFAQNGRKPELTEMYNDVYLEEPE